MQTHTHLQDNSREKWCAQEILGDVECFAQGVPILAEGDGALVQVYVAANTVVFAEGLRGRERTKVILTEGPSTLLTSP